MLALMNENAKEANFDIEKQIEERKSVVWKTNEKEKEENEE